VCYGVVDHGSVTIRGLLFDNLFEPVLEHTLVSCLVGIRVTLPGVTVVQKAGNTPPSSADVKN